MLGRFAAVLSVSLAVSSAAPLSAAAAAPSASVDPAPQSAGRSVERGAPILPAPASTPRAASSAERASYAAREVASPDAQRYKGGSEVVVVSAGTVALVLAIVALVLVLH
jgi:hypothetical protein